MTALRKVSLAFGLMAITNETLVRVKFAIGTDHTRRYLQIFSTSCVLYTTLGAKTRT
jgi:hypothetical protein